MNIFSSILRNYYVCLEDAIEEIRKYFLGKRAHYGWLADAVSEHEQKLNYVTVIKYSGDWTRNLVVDFRMEPEMHEDPTLTGTLKIECVLEKGVCTDVKVELDVQETLQQGGGE